MESNCKITAQTVSYICVCVCVPQMLYLDTVRALMLQLIYADASLVCLEIAFEDKFEC